MSRIASGYTYDIFISYRQKDNRSDQWVTHFVQALREELDATFKEEVSIYFDANPHEGLLETHDVDQSLDEKIKCLILIPIVSRTYCDPNSFAWKKEFLAFRDFAKQDEFGLDIKVSNGNVAKRILPVKIHEIDDTDRQLYERETGGAVRSIDFIYKEAGVNRPLNPDDSEEKNLNKTRYKNQVNKVANAIRELVTSLKSAPMQDKTEIKESAGKGTDINSSKSKSLRFAAFGALTLMIILASYFIFSNKKKDDTQYKYDVAVMYLENLTDDEKYGEGLLNLIQINLAEDTSLNLVPRHKLYDELKKVSPDSKVPDQSVATELAGSIGAKFMVIGRVIQQSTEVLAQVDLIEVSTGKIVTSNKAQGNKDQIFALADRITKKLIEGKTTERNYNVTNLTTGNYEAYKLYYRGLEELWNLEWNAASDNFSKAIQLDSSFTMAYIYLAIANKPFSAFNVYDDLSAQTSIIQKALVHSHNLPKKEQLLAKWMMEFLTSDPTLFKTSRELLNLYPDEKLALLFSSNVLKNSQLKPLEEYLQRNPEQKDVYNNLAYVSLAGGENAKAVEYVDKYLAAFPDLYNAYQSSWEIHLMTGNFPKAYALASQIESKFPTIKSRWVWTDITHLTLQKPELILKHLNKHRDSTFSREYHTLGFNAYLMQGKITKSLSLLDETVRYFSSKKEDELSFLLRMNKPLILTFAMQYQKADNELNRIISDSDRKFTYNPYFFIAHYYKGLNYLSAKNYSGAAHQIELLGELLSSKKYDQRYSRFKVLLETQLQLETGNLANVKSMLDNAGSFFWVGQSDPLAIHVRNLYSIQAGDLDAAAAQLNNSHRQMQSGRPIYGGNQTLYTINLMLRDYYLGQVYEKSGQKDKAIAAYNSFLLLLKDSDPGIAQKEDAQRRVETLEEMIEPSTKQKGRN